MVLECTDWSPTGWCFQEQFCEEVPCEDESCDCAVYGTCDIPVDEEEAYETTFDVDCQTFTFKKTSTANWQEAGVNQVRLKWLWTGANGGYAISRELYIDHLVIGIPMQYSNGTTVSAGQAANITAQMMDAAKFATYQAFRNSPTSPDNSTVTTFFIATLHELMKTKHFGTAGKTGSGSPDIQFNDEERSNWSNPRDC